MTGQDRYAQATLRDNFFKHNAKAGQESEPAEMTCQRAPG